MKKYQKPAIEIIEIIMEDIIMASSVTSFGGDQAGDSVSVWGDIFK